MACSTCGNPHSPAPVPVPVPLPALPPLCEGSELCVEVQDTSCVAYTGAPLLFLDISTDDRLTQILTKMNNRFGLVDTGATYLQGSNQIQVVGVGSAIDPYRIRPIIADVPGNILRNTSIGMLALLTDTDILALLVHIKSIPVLKAAFCAMGCVSVPSSGGGTGGVTTYTAATNLTAYANVANSQSPVIFYLNWLYTGTATQIVEYRVIGQTWMVFGQPLLAGLLTVNVAGLVDDTVYEFRIRNPDDVSNGTVSNTATASRTATLVTCNPPTGVTTSVANNSTSAVITLTVDSPTVLPGAYRVNWRREGSAESGTQYFTTTEPLVITTASLDGTFTGNIKSVCGTTESIGVSFTGSVVSTNCAPPSAVGLTGTVVPLPNSPGYTAGIVVNYVRPTGQLVSTTTVVRYRILGSTGAFTEVTIPTQSSYTILDAAFTANSSYQCTIHTQCANQLISTGTPFTAAPAQASNLYYSMTNVLDPSSNQPSMCNGLPTTIKYSRLTINIVDSLNVPTSVLAATVFNYQYVNPMGDTINDSITVNAGQSTANELYLVQDKLQDAGGGPCTPHDSLFNGITSISDSSITSKV